ncbi:MAG: zinc transporter ZupT [Nitrospirota bacterium]
MIELIGMGAVAGVFPVYLGIGFALLASRMLSRAWEAGLIGLATGVLVYLFFDLMHEAVELTGARDVVSWIVLLGCLLVSFVGLVVLEESQLGKHRRLTRVLSLPYLIALGMGLHNLGEGLAIGTSYTNGEWALSALLVAGFALHNGTEGFGIVGAAGRNSIPAKDVLLLGLLAGAPTCVGAVLSGLDPSPYLSVAWYTLAAGSLLYVILALIALTYTVTRRVQMALGVFAGIALMYVTAMLLTLAGGLRT